MKPDQSPLLPDGVSITALTRHSDHRGDLMEVFRNEWVKTPPPVQWLVSRTRANALRGVHVHARHWDYYFVIEGELVVGLHDLRPAAQMRSFMLRLTDNRPQLVAIPAWVAHGLYAPGGAVFLVGTSECYDPADDIACQWNAPELGLEWPCTAPELSARDRDAGTYSALKTALQAAETVHP